MSKRKSISKTMRFEIFKRDSFNEMYAIACDSDDWEIFLDMVIDVFRTEDR